MRNNCFGWGAPKLGDSERFVSKYEATGCVVRLLTRISCLGDVFGNFNPDRLEVGELSG
jgi:hypothetical protein